MELYSEKENKDDLTATILRNDHLRGEKPCMCVPADVLLDCFPQAWLQQVSSELSHNLLLSCGSTGSRKSWREI